MGVMLGIVALVIVFITIGWARVVWLALRDSHGAQMREQDNPLAWARELEITTLRAQLAEAEDALIVTRADLTEAIREGRDSEARALAAEVALAAMTQKRDGSTWVNLNELRSNNV